MPTRTLEQFAQNARRSLHGQVTAKLAHVLAADSPARRQKPDAVKALERQIRAASKQSVVEAVAYTWFNRFCALRYMDVNHYTRVGVVSPALATGGQAHTQPEILQEAKQGHIDDELPLSAAARQRIFALLAGQQPSPDPQSEAYRLLLVAACNSFHRAMPFLFEEIDDYTELLMPDDLLSAGSILQAMRDALPPDACQDVEVIGWLYQFYISEKKDQVIGSKEKVRTADIPAATQLFTPHWIVRYLVENSLGRLWLQNRPGSRLAERMEYYISEQSSVNSGGSASPTDNGSLITAHLRISSPEEIRLCDPAAGSGHMLTYAFDLLYAIYEEEGYSPSRIPQLILEKNLVGLEIDGRAAALAAFALAMKACQRDRRFLRRGIAPRIVHLRPVALTPESLAELPWYARLGERLTDLPLHDALAADVAAAGSLDAIGALWRPCLSLDQIDDLRRRIGAGEDLFTHAHNRQALALLEQAEALARPYHIVVANPPYMGSRNQNDEIKQFLSDQYPDVKSDLFSAFIVRNCELALPGGQLGFMSPFVWMFISSYEKLRDFLIDQKTITSLVQLEYSGFDGATVPICTFTLENAHHPDYKGGYVRLSDFRGSENQAPKTLEAIRNPDCGWFYRAAAADFKKIPGSPIAYWVSKRFGDVVSQALTLGSIATIREGLTTGNNEGFLRYWHEIAFDNLGVGCSTQLDALESRRRWFPYIKGGDFRRWYGNFDFVVNWFEKGREIHEYAGVPLDFGAAPVRAKQYYFRSGITWTRVSSASTAFRCFPNGFIFDSTGPSIFPENVNPFALASLLNGKPARMFLEFVAPTLDFRIGPVSKIPIVMDVLANERVISASEKCVELAKSDWDAYETSWDFSDLPLLRAEFRRERLAETYAALRGHWQAMTDEMQRLEEENNRLFIHAYGLHDELTPEVPLAEITLTCNPHYRYGSGQLSVFSDQLQQLTEHWSLLTDHWSPDDAGRELRLLADTMREFISYAVGCMFGRYSLDKPGLVLANAGQGIEDYLRLVSEAGDDGDGHRLKPTPDTQNRLKPVDERGPTQSPNRLQPVSPGSHRFESVGSESVDPRPITFPPDRDNVIPILDGDWFEDDMADRFRRFLRVAFGEARYAENLAFIEAALGRDIRSYFLRDFYDDHVKRYQKRPIYWLFSSPKGSFNALIYLHRYRPDTASVVLNEYLREYRSKLGAQRRHLEAVSISAGSSQGEKSAALREMAKIDKILAELEAYEADVLYPLATRQVALDLDDGVKVNYRKLGKALKKVKGLSG